MIRLLPHLISVEGPWYRVAKTLHDGNPEIILQRRLRRDCIRVQVRAASDGHGIADMTQGELDAVPVAQRHAWWNQHGILVFEKRYRSPVEGVALPDLILAFGRRKETRWTWERHGWDFAVFMEQDPALIRSLLVLEDLAAFCDIIEG